jgi:F-type H+-transporting ATPase subunit delta
MASGDLRAAHRYSRALFRTALGRNEVEEVGESLAVVTQSVQNSPQLRAVLHHPLITRDRKKELLRQIFGGTLTQDVENFLFLLIERDRASIIPTIAEQYVRLVDEHNRIANAEAVTAVPMTDSQRDALAAKLEAATGYKIRLTTRVDEEILGGLVVRVGDRLFDGSVTTQLQNVREQLKQVKVS